MKTVHKQLFGAGARELLPFAQNKLDQMNTVADDRPFQRKTLVVRGTVIQLQTSPAGDKILIRTSAGYVISMRVRSTEGTGSVNPTGEQIGTISVLNYLFTAGKPAGQWKPAAASPLPSSINLDFLFQGVAGYGMDSAPQLGGPTPPSGGTDADDRVFVTKDLAKSFQGILWFSDSNRTFTAGHQVKPFIKDGKRGFYFISVASTAQTASLGRYVFGDDAPTYTTLPGVYSNIQGGSPIIDIVNPDKVFGLRGDGTSNGPVYFFVATNNGTMLQQFASNDLFSAYASANQHINARRLSNLFALSDTKALLVTPDPATLRGRTAYNWYLVDFTTGQTTLVLQNVIGKFVNLGNGALVIQSLGVLNATASAYGNFLYTSMDNGATWTTSEAHVPQSTQMGESGNNLANNAALTPLSPYVNADNKGTVYTVSRLAWTQTSGTYTDVQLFASTDLLQSWKQVSTIQMRADYPKTTINGGAVEYDFESAVLVGVGSPNAPLAIDPIQPWRRDSKVAAPASWTMQ